MSRYDGADLQGKLLGMQSLGALSGAAGIIARTAEAMGPGPQQTAPAPAMDRTVDNFLNPQAPSGPGGMG